jgi:hypothetical protein
MISIAFSLFNASPGWQTRYRMECTIFAAQGYVATPWNGTTIPRRCALPCTPQIAHSTLSNYRF